MEKILLIPHPILRQKSKDLQNIEKEDFLIANKMMETMIKAPGAGLAANQVGILKKIITVNIRDEKNIHHHYLIQKKLFYHFLPINFLVQCHGHQVLLCKVYL